MRRPVFAHVVDPIIRVATVGEVPTVASTDINKFTISLSQFSVIAALCSIRDINITQTVLVNLLNAPTVTPK